MPAVMTLDGQRRALVGLLQSVPGIGRVHDYRRIIRDENAIRALLCPPGSDRVNAWMISLAPATTTVTERHPGHAGKGIKGGGNVLTTFQWQIEGYGQIDDLAASERTFSDLTWAVADELNAYGLLDIDGVVHQLPADVEQVGFVMLANAWLGHYGRISIGFQGRTRPA